ncbi:hypothetical protein, partial [Pseudomonas plecoglossicida]|uniref:hypothetical protein n=1 Tax=Pseudomonas plecoglossicida TaxID=70775 RepID=UPI0039E74D15
LEIPVGAGLSWRRTAAIGPVLTRQNPQTIALSRQMATGQLFQRLQQIKTLFYLVNIPPL